MELPLPERTLARPISVSVLNTSFGPCDVSVYETLADIAIRAFLTSSSRPQSNVISIMSSFSV